MSQVAPVMLDHLLADARSRPPDAAGKPRAMIFDVDDTLFRTAPRSLALVREWLASEAGAPWAEACLAIALDHVGYGIEDCLLAAGVPPAAVDDAKAYWAERFFTGDYLHHDTPYERAVDYVQALHRAGVHVVYLTGRWSAMRAATEAALVGAGFPWDEAGGTTRLVTKPTVCADDLAYKRGELVALAEAYEVIGCIDNEPKNVNMFRSLLPTALSIHLAKPHSKDPPPLAAGTHSAADFPALA